VTAPEKRCEVGEEEICSCHLNQHFHAAKHDAEIERLKGELGEAKKHLFFMVLQTRADWDLFHNPEKVTTVGRDIMGDWWTDAEAFLARASSTAPPRETAEAGTTRGSQNAPVGSMRSASKRGGARAKEGA